MRPAEARRLAKRLRPGDVVEVLWLDSGRNAGEPVGLLRGRVYGAVHSVVGDELTLAMDYSEDATGERVTNDGGSETYGVVWIPAILGCWRLTRA